MLLISVISENYIFRSQKAFCDIGFIMAPTVSIRPGDTIGFWGPPSSTINWCETNYEVTQYIAEFWNTITNLGFIIPPLFGLSNCRNLGIESRYAYSFILILLVGIGSWMFHMTLTFEMQLLDEIPMMWCGSYIVYCLYRSRSTHLTTQAKIVGILLSSHCLIGTILYVSNKNPIFFQVMFGIVVTSGVVLSIYHNYNYYSPLGLKLSVLAVTFTLIGFLCWNIDNLYCSQVTSLRERIFRANGSLKYLSPITQLHGWWHIFAGFATYAQILSCIQHRLRFLNIKHSVETTWTGIFIRMEVINEKAEFKSSLHHE